MQPIELLMSEGMQHALDEITNPDSAGLNVKRIYCPVNPEHKRFSFYAKTDLEFGPDGSFKGLAQGNHETSDFELPSGFCVECACPGMNWTEEEWDARVNTSQYDGENPYPRNDNQYGQCIIQMRDGREIITGGISACRPSGFVHAVGNPFEKH